MKKQVKLKAVLGCLLMLSVSGCGAKQFCPAYPEPPELVKDYIVYLYEGGEANTLTPLEWAQLEREDALFKLEDKLKLCK